MDDLDNNLSNKQDKITYTGIYATASAITPNETIMSVEVPSAGTYLVLAYNCSEMPMWAQNITDLANSGYWKIAGGGSGGAKLYNIDSEDLTFTFVNYSGSTTVYLGSYVFLVKLF